MEKLGIENLKVVVKFGVDLGMGIDHALEDGKITLADAGDFYAPMMSIPGVIGAAKDVVPEFKDIDAEELKELTHYAVSELKIAETEVLVVIEKSLAAAVSVFELVGAIKALKKAKEAPVAPVEA